MLPNKEHSGVLPFNATSGVARFPCTLLVEAPAQPGHSEDGCKHQSHD